MSLSDQLTDILDSFGGFGPVLWLMAGFCALLLAELLTLRRSDARYWLGGLTLVVLAVALVWAILLPWRGFLFGRLLFVDGQAQFMQVVVALTALLVVTYEVAGSYPHRSAVSRNAGPRSAVPRSAGPPLPWYALLVAMTLGLFLMTVSVNLLSIYVSIELVSIASYLLTALSGTRRASEGGIKYLIFGAISSAIMLYGMSLLYGMTGTLDLTADVFGTELARQDAAVATVVVLLTGAGLLFKLAGVPFHVWTPDAYQAAPVPVAAFFSVGPKAAAILVLMRVITALPVENPAGRATAGDLQVPLAVLALAGMFIGNLSALRQTDAKRLLAYSTIAHAGFLLVGVVALNRAGFEAVLFYAGTYLFMSLAAFFLIDLLARSQGSEELTVSQFAGLGAKQPLLSVALTITMLGLTGLPPTVGFTAKLLSFSALFDAYGQTGKPWLLALFALGLLNALISLVYYLKIPFLLFFRPLTGEYRAERLSRAAVWLAVSLVIPIIGLFLKPDWLLTLLTGW